MRKFSSIFTSPIGQITIFANDEAILEITFKKKELTEDGENDLTRRVVSQLKDYFEGKLKEFDLPLDQEGTPFQRDVWNRLSLIPYGDTTSYALFSKHKPLAIRAIAAANGKNNLAIVVPCHRVIGSDGKLVGYAGELWRKQWLLNHEREVSQKGQMQLNFSN